MMRQLTVFTPTYNREKTLSRVYESLLNQTENVFEWLIVDDGSSDNTKELVSKWIEDNRIPINYIYKENGGKHTAMKRAYEVANSKYFLAIDSDDELIENAVEVFLKEWDKLEEEGKADEFAEVVALTHSSEGKLIGDFIFPNNVSFIDSFYQEMVYKYKNNNENVICWNLEKLRECVKIPDKIWMQEKTEFPILFGEAILWAKIGRKYKSRYINKGLRVYHYDGGESLMRTTNIRKALYNTLVTMKYFLDENLDYFLWNPRYFINPFLKFMISGIELKISPIYIYKSIYTGMFKISYVIFFPLGIIAWFYFKKIKNRFWF